MMHNHIWSHSLLPAVLGIMRFRPGVARNVISLLFGENGMRPVERNGSERQSDNSEPLRDQHDSALQSTNGDASPSGVSAERCRMVDMRGFERVQARLLTAQIPAVPHNAARAAKNVSPQIGRCNWAGNDMD